MMSFRTCLKSGLGRGAKFVSMPVYSNLFESILGSKPFFGTLNLRVEPKCITIIEEMFKKAEVYDDLFQNDKKMGGVKVIHLQLQYGSNGKKLNVIGVRPLLTSHSEEIIEVIAVENIRELWNLEDGCEIRILINDNAR